MYNLYPKIYADNGVRINPVARRVAGDKTMAFFETLSDNYFFPLTTIDRLRGSSANVYWKADLTETGRYVFVDTIIIRAGESDEFSHFFSPGSALRKLGRLKRFFQNRIHSNDEILSIIFFYLLIYYFFEFITNFTVSSLFFFCEFSFIKHFFFHFQVIICQLLSVPI